MLRALALGVIAALIGDLVAPLAHAGEQSPRPTNLVLIMTDNHGAWTLGCYGNKDIRTPNIDRLASQGLLFTHAFSSNAVCSPTRATYLTGLLPSQHGVHCFLGLKEAQMGPDAYCTIREFPTLPKRLSSAGYHCGMVGKWHLGANLTPQEGFSTWITMPHGATSTFYNAEVIEDGRVRREPTYLTDLWTEHGVQFIESSAERPFFLFLSYNGPYGLGPSLLKDPPNRHAAYYADKQLPSFPREQQHPWLFNNKEYLNNPQAIRTFAAELNAVDDGVGRILETLDRLHLRENTLIVFCGDQGWLGGQHGIWGMGDHTRPLSAFDGMMRVPLIVSQPGRIRSGEKVDSLVSNYDFLPTVLDYLGQPPLKQTPPLSPGRSFAAMLRGQAAPWKDEVFFEFENVRAIRTRDWKYIHRHPQGPDELYDLAHDADERRNLHGEPDQRAQESTLHERLDAFFNRYADPKYDLFRGGESKSRLLTYPEAKPGQRIDSLPQVPPAEKSPAAGKL
jgi:arylsulfatase A-like enzyme